MRRSSRPWAAFLELAAEDAGALLAASGALLGVPLGPMGAGAEAVLPTRAALRRAGLALDLAAAGRARTSWSAGYRALARPRAPEPGREAGRGLVPVDLSRIVSPPRRSRRTRRVDGATAGPHVARAVHAVQALAGTADAASWPEVDLADENAAGWTQRVAPSSRTSTGGRHRACGRCLRRRVQVASRPRAGGGSLLESIDRQGEARTVSTG